MLFFFFICRFLSLYPLQSQPLMKGKLHMLFISIFSGTHNNAQHLVVEKCLAQQMFC